jgi:hypothetical protein
MNKYRVMINCDNLLTVVEGRRQRLGFFTNVFVEAFSPADAESRALELLREDVALRDVALNPDEDPLSFSVEEANEIESFEGVRLPRTGLTLYPLEETM